MLPFVDAVFVPYEEQFRNGGSSCVYGRELRHHVYCLTVGAVLLADPENRGLANSTYYLGLNSGMALGPIIGGMLYGSIPIQLFYPALMFTAPLGFLLYFGSRKLLNVRTNHRE